MSYVSSIIHLRTSCRHFLLLRSSYQVYHKSRATGVTTSVVENMEESFKKDVLRELREGNGRILLHDEVEERPGVFSIIPIWEVVENHEIMTPRDVINLIAELGYRVYIFSKRTYQCSPILLDQLWQSPNCLSQLHPPISKCTNIG